MDFRGVIRGKPKYFKFENGLSHINSGVKPYDFTLGVSLHMPLRLLLSPVAVVVSTAPSLSRSDPRQAVTCCATACNPCSAHAATPSATLPVRARVRVRFRSKLVRTPPSHGPIPLDARAGDLTTWIRGRCVRFWRQYPLRPSTPRRGCAPEGRT